MRFSAFSVTLRWARNAVNIITFYYVLEILPPSNRFYDHDAFISVKETMHTHELV